MSTKGIRKGLYLVKDDCHSMKCRVCGESFDMRDLNEVIKHEHWPENESISTLETKTPH